MEAFCSLFFALDATPATGKKIRLLADFFRSCTPEDASWALHVLLGRQKRRLITGRRLRDICLQATCWPAWLFEECHRHVGDSAETISLLWSTSPAMEGAMAPSPGEESQASLHGSFADWMERRLPSLAGMSREEQAQAVQTLWSGLTSDHILVVNKLLTGGLRVGVSEGLVIRALSLLSGVEEAILKHRLMGSFQPSPQAWQELISPQGTQTLPPSRPYPFFLASPLDPDVLATSQPSQWQVEWKYDGIRCQLIHRQGEVFLWSRGEDLINASFPELTAAAAHLPWGVVLDGEVVIWPPEEPQPRPFGALQRRLGRRSPGKELLREAPACFVIYDLLEKGGEDQRAKPLRERRRLIETLRSPSLPAGLRIAPELPLSHWDALNPLRDKARQAGAEGIMLKQRDSAYLSGRRRGHWWKHKLEPFQLDAVLLYAQAGTGRRANLHTDYTFGLWERPWQEANATDPPPRLVSFAKAYSGLNNEEILRLDYWIRSHTVQRFGPVRAVEPQMVFALAFEGIQPSARHKSGLAVRFPRIHRWRSDKVAREADSLADAKALLQSTAAIPPTR